MDYLYFYGGPFYDPRYPFGMMNYYNPDESAEDREARTIGNFLCVAICYIGFPIAIALGYGVYQLIKLL